MEYEIDESDDGFDDESAEDDDRIGIKIKLYFIDFNDDEKPGYESEVEEEGAKAQTFNRKGKHGRRKQGTMKKRNP